MSEFQTAGPRYHFKNQEFWAQRGLIHIEDQRDGDYKVLSRAEAAARAISLNAQMPYLEYPDERKELCDAVCGLAECVKLAKKQGDPHDPEAAKQVARSERKLSVFFPREIMGSKPKPRLIIAGADDAVTARPQSERFKKLAI